MSVIIDKIIGLLDKVNNKNASISQTMSAVVGSRWETWSLEQNKNPIASNYVIYRSIHLLAQSLAQLPLDLYRGDEPLPRDWVFPDGFDFQNPNSDMSLNELVYYTMFYYFYRGEGMIKTNLIEGTSNVLSLEPVNPRLMKELDENGRIVAWRWNNKITFPMEELIYSKLFNPDGLRGLGPVDVVKNELITDLDATNYNKKFFKNFGKIGGTLYDGSKDSRASVTDMKNVVDQFNQQHQGVDRAHKALGLPGGIKYQEPGQSMREMQFLESRKDIRDRIVLFVKL